MNVNVEYCDPFDGLEDGFWMKVEHCGRYMWAAQWLEEKQCKSVADIACANGYGSRILSRTIGRVIAVDRNETYLNKAEHVDSVQYICCDLDGEPLPDTINNIDAIVFFDMANICKSRKQLSGHFLSVFRMMDISFYLFQTTDMNCWMTKELWEYDKENIELFARIFGKPEPINVEQSYSFIYICRKSRAR